MALGGGGGGGGSASDVRAGGAFVEIWLKDNALQRGLDLARDKLHAWGKNIARVGAVMVAAGGSIIAPIGKLFADFVNEASKAGSMKDMFGGTVESMSRLIEVFKTAGVEADDMSSLFVKFSKAVANGADSPEKSVLAKLGIDARAFIALNPEKKMELIAEQLSKVGNEMDRIDLLTDLFGKKGADTFGILGKGAEAFRQRMKGAEEDGVGITQSQADQAKNVKKTWGMISNSVHHAFLAIGEAILPARSEVASFAKQFIGMIRYARGFIEENSATIRLIAKIGTALVVAGTAITFIGGGVALMGTAIGALLFPLKIAAFLIGALLSPIGLVVSAVAGLSYVFLRQTEVGREFAKRMGGVFGEVGDTAKETWGAVVMAIQGGDMESAFEVAGLGLRVIWFETLEFFEKEWNHFKDNFLQGISQMLDALADLAVKAVREIPILSDAQKGWEIAGDWLGKQLYGDNRTTGPVSIPSNMAGNVPAAQDAQLAPAGGTLARETELQAAKRELREKIDEILRMAEEKARNGKLGGINRIGGQLSLDAQLGPGVTGAATSTKGLFQAANFEQALGIGDSIAKDNNRLLQGIKTGIDGVAKAIANQKALVVE